MEKSINKNLLTLRLLIVYAVSVILLIIVFSAFVRPEPKVIVRQETVERVVTKISDSASQSSAEQLKKLQQQLSDAQAQLSASNAELAKTAEANRAQQQVNAKTAEASLAQQTSAAGNAELRKKDAQIALLQKQVASHPAASDNAELVQLRNEIRQRDKMITELKNKSAATPVSSTASGSDMVKDLQKRNDNLVRGFNSLQTQMGMMTKNYNLAKAENNRLAEQLAKAKND